MKWKIYPENTDYEVSSTGKVRRVSTGNIIKPHTAKKGYYRISLYWGNVLRARLVHRMVLYSFSSDWEDHIHDPVNHKNGKKKDNRLENLEWTDNSRNVKHAYDNGLIRKYKGYYGRKCKLSIEDVKKIKSLIGQGFSDSEVSRVFEVTASNINRIRRGLIWKDVDDPESM